MIESYDGLCGIIARFASSDLRLRCNYCMGHSGPCSFEKYRDQFRIQSSCCADPEVIREEGFINSVLSHSRYDHHTIAITSDNKKKIRK